MDLVDPSNTILLGVIRRLPWAHMSVERKRINPITINAGIRFNLLGEFRCSFTGLVFDIALSIGFSHAN